MFSSSLKSAVVGIGLLLAATPVLAEPVAGRIAHRDQVKANATDIYTVKLLGGETTRIVLSGDGDTCLELRVYDENGFQVASDTFGLGDDRKVHVTPKWTGKFTVKIRNIGIVSNNYVLVMD
jgi:hypothetical protein